eukprot:6183999-Pleurochrysis_carterae.AAC.4
MMHTRLSCHERAEDSKRRLPPNSPQNVEKITSARSTQCNEPVPQQMCSIWPQHFRAESCVSQFALREARAACMRKIEASNGGRRWTGQTGQYTLNRRTRDAKAGF